MLCSGCKSTWYCSTKCQNLHKEYHSPYCTAIVDLLKIETDKIYRNQSVRQEQVDVNTKRKVMKLVGEKPMLTCRLDGKQVELLWDTGSMVSLVDRAWVNENFPDKELLPVSDFISEGLNVRAANATTINFDGVILWKFTLDEDDEGFEVPVLVSSQKITEPILGYNVIEHLVLNGTQEQRRALQLSLDCKGGVIDSLAAVITDKARGDPDLLAEIKTSKIIKVPAGHKTQIKCRVRCPVNDVEETVYFQPKLCEDDDFTFLETVSKLKRGRTNYVYVEVLNTSKIEKILQKGSLVGSVHSVSAVVPMVKSCGVEGVDQNRSRSEDVVVGLVQGEDKGVLDLDDWVPKVDLSHLNTAQQEAVMKVLMEERDVFSRSDTDIGDIKDFKMNINLTDNIPVKEAYRRIPRNLYSEIKNYIDDLINNGWIRESFSSYCSPIVCVRKKDGGMRMCVDYRQLNAKTVPDCQPIPRIQDILDGLSGQKWFSTLDMSKAYHQGYISEDCQHLTAFATPWTLYEWIRIPFGLRNAPPGFQRFMNQMLGDMKGTICEPYLDDVLCFGDTFDNGLDHLRRVLRRLRSRGVKLRPDKCVFLKQEVRYLGRLISADGYRSDPKDTMALDKFRSAPTNIGELRSVLGFVGYFRCYIRDFAKRVKPLYELLKMKEEKKVDKGKKNVKGKGQKYNSKEKINFTAEHEEILNKLIDHLQSTEVIAYPDFDRPFFITCDASGYGLGAVLYQNQNGVDRVIGYASRTLSEAEQKYHSGKLEFLGLKWAVTERFSDYLRYGPAFKVFTDNNPLTYVLTTAKLNAVGMRWINELAEFNFTIQYRPGKENVDADGLSRNPMSIEELKEECTEVIDPRSVATIFVSSEAAEPVLLCDVNVCSFLSGDITEIVSKEELIEAQKTDPVIAPVFESVLAGCKPKRAAWKQLSRESKLLMRNFRKLGIIDGRLIRKTVRFRQIVLPKKYHEIVYVELHEKMAHVGPEKVIDLAQQRFYWPYLAKDVKQHIQRKCRCVVNKKPNVEERAPLVPIHATYPFEMLSLDFMKLDKCKGGFQYALVVVDHFTRFCQMYGTRAKSAKAAASKIWGEFIPKFGFPKTIHHDQGGEFNNELWTELHRLSGVRSSKTTPYHPMGDGQVERLNRTAQNMLKSLAETEKKNWKCHLPQLAFAYNSTVNKATGFSPFFLMFGRESKLPIDTMFGLEELIPKIKRKSHQEFVDEWKKSMGEAFKLANEKIEKTADYNKRHYDKSAHEVEIGIGDRVLMKNVRERGGTGKLRSHWEHSMFEVTEKKADLPVYTITNINKKKDIRVVHRNLLMKANELPENLFQQKKKKKVVAAGKKTVKLVEPGHVAGEDDDDQDQEELVITYHDETRDFAEEEEEDEIIVNDQPLNDTGEEEVVISRSNNQIPIDSLDLHNEFSIECESG